MNIYLDTEPKKNAFCFELDLYTKYAGLLLSQGKEEDIRKFLYLVRGEQAQLIYINKNAKIYLNTWRQIKTQLEKHNVYFEQSKIIQVPNYEEVVNKITGEIIKIKKTEPIKTGFYLNEDQGGDWIAAAPQEKVNTIIEGNIIEFGIPKIKNKKVKTVLHRVHCCGVSKIDQYHNVTIREKDKKHSYHNLQSCGGVWVCAVCQFRVLKQRQNELNSAWELLTRKGGRVLKMITLTTPHFLDSDIKELLVKFTQDWRNLGKSEQQKALTKVAPYWCRAFETRFGANGLHPHFHIVYAVRYGKVEQFTKVAESFIEKWLQYTGGSRDAQKITNFDYKTSYQFENLKELKGLWESQKCNTELTNNLKISKNKSAASIEANQLACVDLNIYKQFCESINGSHRLQCSKMLKSVLSEMPESEILNKAVSDFDKIIFENNAWEILKSESYSKAEIISALNEENNNRLQTVFHEIGLVQILDRVEPLNNIIYTTNLLPNEKGFKKCATNDDCHS